MNDRPVTVDLLVLIGALAVATAVLGTPPPELGLAASLSIGAWAVGRMLLARHDASSGSRIVRHARFVVAPALLLALATVLAIQRTEPWVEGEARGIHLTDDPAKIVIHDEQQRLWHADLLRGVLTPADGPGASGDVIAIGPRGRIAVRGINHRVGTSDFYYSTIAVWTVGERGRQILSSGTRGGLVIDPAGRWIAGFADSHEGGGELVVQQLGKAASPEPIRLMKDVPVEDVKTRKLAFTPDGLRLWLVRRVNGEWERRSWVVRDWSPAAGPHRGADAVSLVAGQRGGGVVLAYGSSTESFDEEGTSRLGQHFRHPVVQLGSGASALGLMTADRNANAYPYGASGADGGKGLVLPSGPVALAGRRGAVLRSSDGRLAVYDLIAARPLRVAGRVPPVRRLVLTLVAGLLAALAVLWIGARPSDLVRAPSYKRLTAGSLCAVTYCAGGLVCAVQGIELPPFAYVGYLAAALLCFGASWRAPSRLDEELVVMLLLPLIALLIPLAPLLAA